MIPEYVEDPNHNTLIKRGCAILRFPFFWLPSRYLNTAKLVALSQKTANSQWSVRGLAFLLPFFSPSIEKWGVSKIHYIVPIVKSIPKFPSKLNLAF
jgi:hypothetical protein